MVGETKKLVKHPIEQIRLSRRSAGETSTAWICPSVLTSAKRGEYNITRTKLAQ